jgi:hypothetical protein
VGNLRSVSRPHAYFLAHFARQQPASPAASPVDATLYETIPSARELSTEFVSFALACTGGPLLLSLQLMTRSTSEVAFKGRAGRLIGDASQRLNGRQRRERNSWRESEVASRAELEGWHSAQAGGHLEGKAGRLAPGDGRKLARRHSQGLTGGASRWLAQGGAGDATTDESRRLGSKAGPEGRTKAQAGGRLEGRAGRWIEGASWRFVGRHGRRIGRRRKPQVVRKAGPEGRSKAQAGDRSDGKPEDWSTAQAADRLEGAVGSDADESRRLSWKATPEGWQPTQVGSRRKLATDASRWPMRAGG